MDWTFIERHRNAKGRRGPVFNLIQHVRHADSNDPRFQFLGESAIRICVSQEVAQAVRPHANGPVQLIENGIPLARFAETPHGSSTGTVDALILGTKQPQLACDIEAGLRRRGLVAHAIIRPVPREALARHMQRALVFVGLPNAQEGFYLPALEAMASGCAVVCADAIGNRAFCQCGFTALMPAPQSVADHVAAVVDLIANNHQRDRLVRNARAMASRYGLSRERCEFYGVMTHYGFVPTCPSSILQRIA
jgi:glycosyltransferase involved in cell wall biosynthesis